jgi:hypothetical protein
MDKKNGIFDKELRLKVFIRILLESSIRNIISDKDKKNTFREYQKETSKLFECNPEDVGKELRILIWPRRKKEKK